MDLKIQRWWVAVMSMLLQAGVWAQTPTVSPPADDVMNRPSEYGLRMTPGIARSAARAFVRNGVICQYGLDNSREDELTEMVARRMMAAIHAVDNAEGQAMVERLAGTMMKAAEEGERRGGHRPKFSAEMARSFGQDMMKIMPHVRGLVRDVAQDIRPQLSMQQQLQFVGELMAVNAALDGFEGVMSRWSAGEVVDGEDPFDDDNEMKLDEDGVSWVLKRARKMAQGEGLCEQRASKWKRYVKDAKEFYGFDETQLATADSILREIKSRLDVLCEKPELKTRRQQYLIWSQLRWWLGPEYRGNDGTLKYLLERSERTDDSAFDALDRELKQRIEKIPRSEQLRAADQRVEARLAEVGIGPDTQPAEGSDHVQ